MLFRYINIMVVLYILLYQFQAWSLPICKGSPLTADQQYQFWTNCQGTFIWTQGENSGDTYVGEWKDDKKHGQGTYTYASDDKYVGKYKDDLMHGFGTFYFLADNEFKGDIYVGEWKDSKAHGQGTYAYAAGDTYVGEFKDNEFNGYGTLTFPNGENYVGEWKDDKRHGQGTYSFPDGEKYVGEFRNDKYHGQGILTLPNGVVWEGMWKDNEWVDGRKYAVGENNNAQLSDNNLPVCAGSPLNIYTPEEYTSLTWHNCRGIYTIKDPQAAGAGKDNKFEGEFKDGNEHGHGTYTFADGENYVGEFKNGKYDGHGTLTFPDGENYVGEWKDDKKYGHGTYTWTNGQTYVGTYKDGKRHGQGTYSFPNGENYVGEWIDSKKHGHGTLTFANGENYVGEFRDDNYDGQGRYTFSDGRVWEGTWKDGEWVDGRKYAAGENNNAQLSDNNLPVCSGSPLDLYSREDYTSLTWHNCRGIVVVHDPEAGVNKGAIFEGEWKDGKRHGLGKYSLPNGENYVGEYKNDKKHGHGTYTFADGENYVGEWKNGEKQGQGTLTFASGQKYVGEFKNGKYDGHGTYTFPDGENYVGEFRDDKYHGEATLIYADGEVWEGTWKDDEWVDGRKYAAGEYNNEKLTHNLPTCIGSPLNLYSPEDYTSLTWHNCRGVYVIQDPRAGANKGDVYVGEFKDGKSHGQGSYTYANGEIYVGQFKNDDYDGHGTYTFTDGENYVGEWKNGNYHGLGTLTFPNGRVWEGTWKDNKWVSGNKYESGEYNPRVSGNDTKQTRDRNNEIIPAASGSGFVVSSLGHIVTNHHVVEGCESVKVHQKGNILEATVLDVDVVNDLAIIRGTFRPSVVFPVSADNAKLMQEIFVAGYPFGTDISTSVKVTKGIISSLAGIGNNYSNIQIDAALQPGNSGGPILDNKGNVIGVAVAKLDLENAIEMYGVVPEGTNFGIKSSVLINFLEANGVKTKKKSNENISLSELGQMITDGTLFLSCWMTNAQIESYKAKKVMFENLH